MAEAIVEERPAMPPRYYCHFCNVEINIPNADFTCPLCSGGFVEELPAQVQSTGNANGASTSRSGSNSTDQAPINRIADLNALRREIASLLMDRYGPNIEISLDSNMGGPRSQSSTNVQETGNSNHPNQNRAAATRIRRNFGPNMLFEFLNSLDGRLGGNTSMVYLGNIGDYAWGREGIDTVVTQLLNQMETAGPPPLSKEKIDEIPKVQVTQSDVDKKVQCSVCWEDFQINEIVRKLPCSHIYHENCIVPWLDLHGTCPICRQSLTNEEEHGGSDSGNDGSHQNNSERRADGGGNSGNPVIGSNSNGPPTMRDSALDDLD